MNAMNAMNTGCAGGEGEGEGEGEGGSEGGGGDVAEAIKKGEEALLRVVTELMSLGADLMQ